MVATKLTACNCGRNMVWGILLTFIPISDSLVEIGLFSLHPYKVNLGLYMSGVGFRSSDSALAMWIPFPRLFIHKYVLRINFHF